MSTNTHLRSRYSKARIIWRSACLLTISVALSLANVTPVHAAQEQGSVGLTGQISAPPPGAGATISVPGNGQTFNAIPITVSGLCPGDLLIKLFKNNIFAGSTQCKNGSFSLQIDLFNGQNDLVARVYDALDQAGPDSNTVTVNFASPNPITGSQISLTTSYAKRGANPGQALTWPIILSGGTGPYAISVDWGDGKTLDLISQQFPGTINLEHVYDSAGVYNIIIKASDKNGSVAFLQLVGVANGPLSQEQQAGSADADGSSTQTPAAKVVWWPAAILLPFLLSTFWLGKKYELKVLRRKIEKGEHPFK